MRSLSPIYLCFLPVFVLCQSKDSGNVKMPASRTAQVIKPEIFTNGFIDIINNGQVNASARFIRLFIGEPGKFAVPLSIYSGVSANNFQGQLSAFGQRTNDCLISAFINPLSGFVNVSTDGILFFNKTEKITRAGLLYQLGERILTGYKSGPPIDPQTGNPFNFLNSFVNAGFYFQTAAWERSNVKNVGVFWLASRYHTCYTNPAQISAFLSGVQTNGIYNGYSLGFGVEINNLLNIKAIYYNYIKPPEIDYSLPVYQFSFSYSMKN